MKLCHVTLYVKDLEKSIAFYRDIIGLPVAQRFHAGPNTEIVFFGGDETKVELICDKTVTEPNLGKDISLGFMVESLEDMIAVLKEKQVKILTDIISAGPTAKFFFALDPDGLKIQFIRHG